MEKTARTNKNGYKSASEVESDIRLYTDIIDDTKDEMVKDKDNSHNYLEVIVELNNVLRNLSDLKNNFNLVKQAQVLANS